MSTVTAVESVATLQTLAGTFVAGDAVVVEGYFQRGDGGGGDFFFEGAVPTSATIVGATVLSTNVSGATNAVPIVITTTTAHGVVSGQSVLINGVSGNNAANGSWIVTYVSATQFSLNDSIGNGVYTSGGTVNSITVQTAAANNVSIGSRVLIAGVTWVGGTGINGTWTNVGVVNATTFSIPPTTVPVTGTYGSSGYFGDGGMSIPSTVATVNGRWLRTLPKFDVRCFGAKADGTTDDYFAFTTAIAAMGTAPTISPLTGTAWPGRLLFVPKGAYRLSRSLRISRQMQVQGEVGYGWFGSSILQFDAGICGIIIDSPGTSPVGGRGDWSVIKDLEIVGGPVGSSFDPPTRYYAIWQPNHSYIIGQIVTPTVTYQNAAGAAFICTQSGTSGIALANEPNWDNLASTYSDNTVNWQRISAHGVWIQGHGAACEQLFISGFPGNGFNITGVTGTSNANGWQLHRGRVDYCGGNGLYVTGGDANVGYCSGLDCSYNDGWGFRDDSAYSSVYVATHTQANRRGAYWASHGSFWGAYAEGGQGASYFGPSASWHFGVPGGGDQDNFTNQFRPTWQSKTYAAGSYVRPTNDNGYYYYTSSGGTAGASEPNPWPIGNGRTVLDGAITWTCYGITTLTVGVTDSGGQYNNPRNFTNPSNPNTYVFEAGNSNTPNTFWGWSSSADSADYQLLEDSNGYGWQALAYSRSGPDSISIPKQPFCVSTNRAILSGESAGMLQIPSPFFLGSAYTVTLGGQAFGDRVKMWTGVQAPNASTGYWHRGSFVWNTVADGGILGWVCTAAGTPGVWTPVIVGGVQQNINAGGAVSINSQSGQMVVLTSNASITSLTITGGHYGQTLTLEMVQSSSAHTWPSTIANVRLIGGTFTKSTATGAIDVMHLRFNSVVSKWDQVAPTALAIS